MLHPFPTRAAPVPPRQGMPWAVAPYSSQMHLPLSTVRASLFPYRHIFLPFGSGYSSQWLLLIGRQWLVPRSQVYGRSAFPCKGNQRAPAQRHSKGHHSLSDTGSLLAANPSQLACFHQVKEELYRLKPNSASIGQIHSQDVDNHPDHLFMTETNTAMSAEVYGCAQRILYLDHNQTEGPLPYLQHHQTTWKE